MNVAGALLSKNFAESSTEIFDNPVASEISATGMSSALRRAATRKPSRTRILDSRLLRRMMAAYNRTDVSIEPEFPFLVSETAP